MAMSKDTSHYNDRFGRRLNFPIFVNCLGRQPVPADDVDSRCECKIARTIYHIAGVQCEDAYKKTEVCRLAPRQECLSNMSGGSRVRPASPGA